MTVAGRFTCRLQATSHTSQSVVLERHLNEDFYLVWLVAQRYV